MSTEITAKTYFIQFQQEWRYIDYCNCRAKIYPHKIPYLITAYGYIIAWCDKGSI